jgi:4'-phosphopantetheinyl transferase
MALCFQDTVNIHTLPAPSGITVWYANIPAIINAVFICGTYHNFRAMDNQIFKKQDFAFHCFNDLEIKTVNRFRALKKQLEWMAGRYLIKQMISTVFLENCPLDMITVSYQKQGAPFIDNHPDIPISMSHSHDYTAAACSDNPEHILGIDVEKIQKKGPDPAFLNTAFTQKEIESMPCHAAGIFTHWTIKEAYLKYIKKGFNESLHNVEVINGDIYHHQKKTNVRICSKKIRETYMISLVSSPN